jgi:type IV secretory pathway VirB2 component (pilin)
MIQVRLAANPPATNSDATKITIQDTDLNLKEAPTEVGSANVTSLLGTVYFWAGIVAVIVIVVGGIRYTTANGDPGKIKAGKDTILYAIVGIVVIIMATAITQFVGQEIK